MPQTRIDIERQLGAALVPMARAYRRYIDRGLASMALSHSTALAVMVLGRLGDGVRQRALADELGLEAPSVVPLLDGMERDGLVERRVDPDDKRVRTLHLTETGRALATEAESRTVKIRESVFAGVPDSDLSATLRVLDRLARQFSTEGQG
jgi:MarR family transcriptional regulator, transcriptional regulator for hemolysin